MKDKIIAFFKSISKLPLIAAGVFLFSVFASLLNYSVANQNNQNTKEEALSKIFITFPEVVNQGLGQYYFYEQIGSSWYVGLGYGGSGVQIVGGDCFRVTGNEIQYINSLQRTSSEITEINPVSCEGQ